MASESAVKVIPMGIREEREVNERVTLHAIHPPHLVMDENSLSFWPRIVPCHWLPTRALNVGFLRDIKRDRMTGALVVVSRQSVDQPCTVHVHEVLFAK